MTHRTPHLPRTPSDVLLGLTASPQTEHFPAVVVARPEHSGNIEFAPSSVPARPRGSRADVALKQSLVMSKQCCTKLKCFSNPELRRHLVSDRTAFRAKSSLLERYDIQLIYSLYHVLLQSCALCSYSLSAYSRHTMAALFRKKKDNSAQYDYFVHGTKVCITYVAFHLGVSPTFLSSPLYGSVKPSTNTSR